MDGVMNLAALCIAAFFITASATAGMAFVCRLAKWGPVNVTLNTYLNRDSEPSS